MTSQERLKEIEKELLGYEEVAKKIDELRKEKTKITKTLEKEKYSALPFEERFRNHVYSEKGKILGNAFEVETEAPLFWGLVKGKQKDRYRIYHLDNFEEELMFLFDPKAKEEWFKEKLTEEECNFDDPEEVKTLTEAYQEDFDEYVKMAEKLMKDNIGGFEYDW